MKKIFPLIVLLCMFIIPAQAVSDERGYISVSSSANMEIAPDVAEISVTVQTFDGKSMQKAAVENKEISENVLNAMKKMINQNNGDYVKTSDYNASPVYSYSGSRRILDKYQVSNTVIIHTKSIDKVGAMIDKAVSLGASNISNLSFSVSNYEAQCNELLVTASKKAQTRAELLAKALSSNLDGIRSMDVSCSANSSVRTRMFAANKMSDMASGEESVSSTAIESGVIKIFANLNASYFVKKGQ